MTHRMSLSIVEINLSCWYVDKDKIISAFKRKMSNTSQAEGLFSGCAVESCVLLLQAGRFQIVSVTRLKWKVSLIFFLDCTDNDDLRADFPWMGSTKTPENLLVRRWDCLIFMDWSLVTWKMRQDLLFIYNFFWFLQRCSECSRRWFMSFVVDDEDLKLFIVKVKVAFFQFWLFFIAGWACCICTHVTALKRLHSYVFMKSCSWAGQLLILMRAESTEDVVHRCCFSWNVWKRSI